MPPEDHSEIETPEEKALGQEQGFVPPANEGDQHAHHEPVDPTERLKRALQLPGPQWNPRKPRLSEEEARRRTGARLQLFWDFRSAGHRLLTSEAAEEQRAALMKECETFINTRVNSHTNLTLNRMLPLLEDGARRDPSVAKVLAYSFVNQFLEGSGQSEGEVALTEESLHEFLRNLDICIMRDVKQSLDPEGYRLLNLDPETSENINQSLRQIVIDQEMPVIRALTFCIIKQELEMKGQDDFNRDIERQEGYQTYYRPNPRDMSEPEIEEEDEDDGSCNVNLEILKRLTGRNVSSLADYMNATLEGASDNLHGQFRTREARSAEQAADGQNRQPEGLGSHGTSAYDDPDAGMSAFENRSEDPFGIGEDPYGLFADTDDE